MDYAIRRARPPAWTATTRRVFPAEPNGASRASSSPTRSARAAGWLTTRSCCGTCSKRCTTRTACHGALPELRWRVEDHRGDPRTAGDREDSHAPVSTGPGTAVRASPSVATASGLRPSSQHVSGGPVPRAAGIGCATASQSPGLAADRGSLCFPCKKSRFEIKHWRSVLSIGC